MNLRVDIFVEGDVKETARFIINAITQDWVLEKLQKGEEFDRVEVEVGKGMRKTGLIVFTIVNPAA